MASFNTYVTSQSCALIIAACMFPVLQVLARVNVVCSGTLHNVTFTQFFLLLLASTFTVGVFDCHILVFISFEPYMS
jgi:hypothetical protein